MKKLLFLVPGLLFVFLLTGCTSVKRFKSAVYKSEDNTLVEMKLFGAKLTPREITFPERNLWHLSASAQTQLIQILNERFPDNEQFIRSIGMEFPGNEAKDSPGYIRQDLRMVFTISKHRDFKALNDDSRRFSPADRIEYLKFSLEIPEEYNLRFCQWNRFTTEYGEVEIADVSFSKSMSLDFENSIEEISDISGKASYSRNESQEVRSRYLKLNGSISDRRIEIEEEGTREIDLTGNVIADVSLEFSGFPERISIPLFSGNGINGDHSSEVVALKFLDLLVPRMEEAHDSIKATLAIEYIYRHVHSGWKTYPEWDDRVEYYSGEISKEITLFSSQDYLPLFYGIGTEVPGREIMKIRIGTGKEYPLQFRNLSDAGRFLEWLMNHAKQTNDPIVVGNTALWFRGRPVTAGQLAGTGTLKPVPIYR